MALGRIEFGFRLLSIALPTLVIVCTVRVWRVGLKKRAAAKLEPATSQSELTKLEKVDFRFRLLSIILSVLIIVCAGVLWIVGARITAEKEAAVKQELATTQTKLNEAHARLNEQDKSLSTAVDKAQQLEGGLEQQAKIAEAQSGSRSAYDQLRETARTDSGDVGRRATLAVKEIEQSYDFSGTYLSDNLTISKAPNGQVLVRTLPVEEILKALQSPERKFRKGGMDALAEKNDKAAIPYIIEHLKKEQDLRVCVAGIRALCVLTGEKTSALDFDHWLSWTGK